MIRSAGRGTKLLFPGVYNDTPHFGSSSLRLYRALDQTCRQALHGVCDKLKISRNNADRIVDEVNQIKPSVEVKSTSSGDVCTTSYMHEGYISSSLLDVFCYGNSFSVEDGSSDKFHNNHSSHTDSGILTLVPVADVPGLEVEDQTLQAWLPLEKMVHESMGDHRRYGTIFWGDSYIYLTKTQLKPCLHRVAKSDKVRYSIVFKMRTKPLATAPRYQEDYDLALLQLRSLHSVQGRKNTQRVMAFTSLVAIALIGYNIYQGRGN